MAAQLNQLARGMIIREVTAIPRQGYILSDRIYDTRYPLHMLLNSLPVDLVHNFYSY